MPWQDHKKRASPDALALQDKARCHGVSVGKDVAVFENGPGKQHVFPWERTPSAKRSMFNSLVFALLIGQPLRFEHGFFRGTAAIA